ncbi:MAG: GYF domain-containing protein [Litorimonas sp.]
MNSGHDHTQPRRQWFIQVDGQAYGPFDDKTLWEYMIEGRVSAQSLVSQSANTGYRPVSADPGLMNWIAQATDQTPKDPKPEPSQTVFMIMAEIKSGRGMNFLQTLQNLGPTQRLGNTVWVLQARAEAETLRDILSQPLGADDRLFVLDSFANETAWFNLSPEMDAQIAKLWSVDR